VCAPSQSIICVYVYLHIYIYTHIHTPIHTCTYTYTYVHTCTHTHRGATGVFAQAIGVKSRARRVLRDLEVEVGNLGARERGREGGATPRIAVRVGGKVACLLLAQRERVGETLRMDSVTHFGDIACDTPPLMPTITARRGQGCAERGALRNGVAYFLLHGVYRFGGLHMN